MDNIPNTDDPEKGVAVFGALAVMFASVLIVYLLVRWCRKAPALMNNGYSMPSPIRLQETAAGYPWEEEDEIHPEEVEVND